MKKRNGMNIKYFKPQDFIAYYTHIETDHGTTVSSGIVLVRIAHFSAVQIKKIRNTIETAENTFNERADDHAGDLFIHFKETYEAKDFHKDKQRIVPLLEEIETLPILMVRKMITGNSRQLLHDLNQFLDLG